MADAALVEDRLDVVQGAGGAQRSAAAGCPLCEGQPRRCSLLHRRKDSHATNGVEGIVHVHRHDRPDHRPAHRKGGRGAMHGGLGPTVYANDNLQRRQVLPDDAVVHQ